jgi:hypothetical protein
MSSSTGKVEDPTDKLLKSSNLHTTATALSRSEPVSARKENPAEAGSLPHSERTRRYGVQLPAHGPPLTNTNPMNHRKRKATDTAHLRYRYRFSFTKNEPGLRLHSI